MQVEEKPDVTYSDVGGCKEQIEKLREVVETPLLHVSNLQIETFIILKVFWSSVSIWKSKKRYVAEYKHLSERKSSFNKWNPA